MRELRRYKPYYKIRQGSNNSMKIKPLDYILIFFGAVLINIGLTNIGRYNYMPNAVKKISRALSIVRLFRR